MIKSSSSFSTDLEYLQQFDDAQDLKISDLSSYLTEINSIVRKYKGLLSLTQPFQPGDKVVLVKVPDFEKAPGWAHCAHFLVKDAPAEVVSVCFETYGRPGYIIGVNFFFESYKHFQTGELIPIERKSVFMFSAESLKLFK